MLSINVNIKMCKTINLPFVLNGCETWSLTLREEYRLRVLDNRVLRITSGPMRDKVRGGWKKLHNDKLYSLHSSPNIKMIKSRKI
jgi:hypothetical protein